MSALTPHARQSNSEHFPGNLFTGAILGVLLSLPCMAQHEQHEVRPPPAISRGAEAEPKPVAMPVMQAVRAEPDKTDVRQRRDNTTLWLNGEFKGDWGLGELDASLARLKR